MVRATAVILGGGRGSRLFPLTLQRSKPAVSFAGKYRLIDIPISNCINSGIKRVFVLTQFMSASLHRHIMQTYHFDTFTDGFIDILAAEQTPHASEWFQGTADAVRATLNHTTYYTSEQMLILSGDHLYRMDYSELISFHREHMAEITLCVCPVKTKDAHQMGLIKVGNNGEVEEFVEKPKDPALIEHFIAPKELLASQGMACNEPCCLASMGIYLFQTDVLVDILTSSSQTDFGKEVIPSVISKYHVMAYPFVGYWRDIGTISSFFEANIALAQPAPPFYLYQPHWPIYTRTRSLPPSRVIHSEIRDSLIVEGSDITGATIADSIVGMRGIVQKGTQLKEVVILGNDFYEGEHLLDGEEQRGASLPPLGIGKNCTIEKAIIDKNVRIGDGVTIRAKSSAKDSRGTYRWLCDGITVIPKGTVIPADTEL